MNVMKIARLAVLGAALTWAAEAAVVSVTALSAGPALGQAVVPTIYSCPMHPDVRTTTPGSCPRCGMKLIEGGETKDDRFVLDVTTEPLTPRAGQPVTLRFVVRSESGEMVRDFTEIHERLFHLFVVSDDLGYFDHIHPALREDGSLTVTTTLPRSGRYQLYGDFVPQGSTPQFLTRTLYTAGKPGDPAARRVALTVNDGPQPSDDAVGELQLPPGLGLVSGELQAFRLHLRDALTSAPVVDLEPYLGAPAHLLTVSADLTEAFHSHPALDFSSTNGPDIVFEAVFPRPGLYRMWFQFQRHARLHTLSFTVPVSLPPSAR
jgi:hypothetical protein